MRFVIVTGMSGAGKTTALKMLEDMGYFCVDNLPIAMFPGFVQMIENSETPMKKVALGVDVRSGQDISGLEKDLEQMDQKGIKYEILFLDAKDSVLVKRYKETRRQHPQRLPYPLSFHLLLRNLPLQPWWSPCRRLMNRSLPGLRTSYLPLTDTTLFSSCFLLLHTVSVSILLFHDVGI